MEIIKEQEINIFNFKLKLCEEFNKYENKNKKYFLMFINDEKVKNSYKKYFKYNCINIEHIIKDILYENVYFILNKKSENNNDTFFNFLHLDNNDKKHFTISIGKSYVNFNTDFIYPDDTEDKIKDFVNCIRNSIKILIEQWTDLNVPIIIETKDF